MTRKQEVGLFRVSDRTPWPRSVYKSKCTVCAGSLMVRNGLRKSIRLLDRDMSHIISPGRDSIFLHTAARVPPGSAVVREYPKAVPNASLNECHSRRVIVTAMPFLRSRKQHRGPHLGL